MLVCEITSKHRQQRDLRIHESQSPGTNAFLYNTVQCPEKPFAPQLAPSQITSLSFILHSRQRSCKARLDLITSQDSSRLSHECWCTLTATASRKHAKDFAYPSPAGPSMFQPSCSSTLPPDAVQRSQPFSMWRPRQSCPSKNASSRSTSVRRRAPVPNALNIIARFEIHEALWQLRSRNQQQRVVCHVLAKFWWLDGAEALVVLDNA